MRKVLPLFFFVFSMHIFSQKECPLGVGGKDDDTIIEVFQLNEEQTEKMRNWSAELKIRNTLLKDKAKHLLKRNEESPPDVLMKVSKEYKDILDSMKANSLMIDKRLLSIFNERQYGFYLELCSGISLRPIFVNGPNNEK
ncbi:hypothetical protein [Flagellimonas allohymeniacidonis]|uniref:Periplasmic heavy metal sensor n=1 Tax=Flagellimonas allohymeniacidonis TaxID=2517819 RepID=A0A4Q8QFX1_9FLAO|nr:hypothetical protein [Allomuricauda hymeniacidonis]TAI49415.1 hypothetical protein EW142_06345 [Allomuricauda hymeniacidonis]